MLPLAPYIRSISVLRDFSGLCSAWEGVEKTERKEGKQIETKVRSKRVGGIYHWSRFHSSFPMGTHQHDADCTNETVLINCHFFVYTKVCNFNRDKS